MRAAPITNSTSAPIQDETSGAGAPKFFKQPRKPALFQSFPPMPAELTRKSQPIRIRPISKKASAVVAAISSVWDSKGCDESDVWLDMVSLMVSPMIRYRWFATVKSQAHDNESHSLRRACARSEFPPDRAVERPNAATADQEE